MGIVTTPTYGIRAPDDQELVQHGASAMRDLTGDVETAMKPVDATAQANAALVVSHSFPVGTILQYAGGSAPDTNWLVCDGRAIAQATYGDLYQVIATRYGTGAAGQFRVPDLRGRVPVGLKTGDADFGTAGKVGGVTHHVLTHSQMPSHSHSIAHNHAVTLTGGQHRHPIRRSKGSGRYNYTTTWNNHADYYTSDPLKPDRGAHTHRGYTGGSRTSSSGRAGSNHSFALLQPYVVTNFLIRAKP